MTLLWDTSGTSLSAHDRVELRNRRVPAPETVTASSSRDIFSASRRQQAPVNLYRWRDYFLSRLLQLNAREAGWDSYGAPAMHEDVALRMYRLLLDLDAFIQSAPAVSLTSVGGLLCEWQGPDVSLDLEVNPGKEPQVYVADRLMQWELEAPVSHITSRLDKWLWQASAD